MSKEAHSSGSKVLSKVMVLTLFVCCVSPNTALAEEETDREKDGLLGPVKSITTKDDFLVQTIFYDRVGRREKVSSMLVRRPAANPMSEVHRRDDHGRLKESLIYGTDGVLHERITYWRDSKLNVTAKFTASSKNEIHAVELYQYDARGNRILKIEIDRGGVIERKQYTYDEKNRLAAEQLFAANGLLKSEAKYIHDGGLKLKEERWYEEDGALAQTTRHRYDEQGSEVEQEIIVGGAIVEKTSIAYEKDEQGNWTKKTETLRKAQEGRLTEKIVSTVEREISYY